MRLNKRSSNLLPLTLLLIVWSCQKDSVQPSADVRPAGESASILPLPGVIPAQFMIRTPYPNPASGSTSIEIDVPDETDAVLVAQNPLGDVIIPLIARHLSAGSYSVVWDLNNSSGISVRDGFYFITLSTSTVRLSTILRVIR